MLAAIGENAAHAVVLWGYCHLPRREQEFIEAARRQHARPIGHAKLRIRRHIATWRRRDLAKLGHQLVVGRLQRNWFVTRVETAEAIERPRATPIGKLRELGIGSALQARRLIGKTG